MNLQSTQSTASTELLPGANPASGWETMTPESLIQWMLTGYEETQSS